MPDRESKITQVKEISRAKVVANKAKTGLVIQVIIKMNYQTLATIAHLFTMVAKKFILQIPQPKILTMQLKKMEEVMILMEIIRIPPPEGIGGKDPCTTKAVAFVTSEF